MPIQRIAVISHPAGPNGRTSTTIWRSRYYHNKRASKSNFNLAKERNEGMGTSGYYCQPIMLGRQRVIEFNFMRQHGP